jgi:hypothetical protein
MADAAPGNKVKSTDLYRARRGQRLNLGGLNPPVDCAPFMVVIPPVVQKRQEECLQNTAAQPSPSVQDPFQGKRCQFFFLRVLKLHKKTQIHGLQLKIALLHLSKNIGKTIYVGNFSKQFHSQKVDFPFKPRPKTQKDTQIYAETSTELALFNVLHLYGISHHFSLISTFNSHQKFVH